MMKPVMVIKASGEREVFNEAKLRHSLERAGASPELIDRIVEHIDQDIRDDMRTADIYRRAFTFLRRNQRSIAARYNLKKAIMELGPTGRPFEHFVGQIFAREGFEKTRVGVMVHGACIMHEVDVLAERGNKIAMIECKFHNHPGTMSDVKVALYVHARFQDIRAQWNKDPAHASQEQQGWLVTNTKLTDDAIQYAACVGLRVIGWSYPAGDSLQDRIERLGLHPLTCLTTLNAVQKQTLLEDGTVLCRDVLTRDHQLEGLGIRGTRKSQVMDEIEQVCIVPRH